MKERSLASIKREEKRKNPKTLEFKRQINEFLENKHSEVVYGIKRDLACMTSMPFYKDRPERINVTLSHKELLIKYMEIFVNHSDKGFIITLIKALNENQAQTIRKVAPKFGKKSEIWEHAIPAKFIVDELIKMIKNNDISEINKLLDIYELAGQRGITRKQDLLLANYRSTMPENWNWRKKDADPLFRHKKVGIRYD